MTQKKQSRRRRKQQPSSRTAAANGFKVLAAALFLLVFLALSLLGLDWLRQQNVAQRPVPPPPPERPLPAQDVQVEIESALLRSGVSLDRLQRSQTDGVVRYQVEGAWPDAEALQFVTERLQRLDPRLSLRADSGQRQLSVRFKGQPVLQVLFVPLPVIAPGHIVRAAIIMDDLGLSLAAVRDLVTIDLNVTGAILPDQPHSREISLLLHRHGRQVMVHLPMEPQGYPQANPGPRALMAAMTPEQIGQRTDELLRVVPEAVGANNHMGSRLTESSAAMQAVMAVLKSKGMFFVDSKTSPRSVGLNEARRAGVPTLGRDLFLDNVATTEAIRFQLRKLIRLARERGQAVAICHPYPQTLEALRLEAPAFREMGVEVVPVSQLIYAGTAN